jgi:hypothetical protein
MRIVRNAISLLSCAVALGLCAPTGLAQNCAGTSVGLTPINDLGSGSYLGSQGGLYPGGTNVRPIAHTVGGLAQAAAIVPRDASGAPAAGGKIVFLSIGMSNCTQEFSRFVADSASDALRSPNVVLVDGAQGGQTATIILDPNANFWTVVAQRLQAAGVSAQQVQAIWFKEADASPSTGWPAYAQTLQSEFEGIMGVIHAKFTNARICYMASRIYAGYATSALNPEPYSYQQGFSIKWVIEDQINGSPALNYDAAQGPVASPWIDWGTYNWADGLTPRSDGLTWACSDYVTDGTHPSNAGKEKVAQILLAFVHSEPTAASWYLKQPAPAPYGTGKLTSLSTLPTVGWTGTPSLATNDFAFTYTGGIPHATGLGFFSPLPANVPFINATRYVGSPLVRLPTQALSATGSGSFSIPIQPGMVGATRFYQGWMRDVNQADGTGAVVSNALRVVFSN